LAKRGVSGKGGADINRIIRKDASTGVIPGGRKGVSEKKKKMNKNGKLEGKL